MRYGSRKAYILTLIRKREGGTGIFTSLFPLLIFGNSKSCKPGIFAEINNFILETFIPNLVFWSHPSLQILENSSRSELKFWISGQFPCKQKQNFNNSWRLLEKWDNNKICQLLPDWNYVIIVFFPIYCQCEKNAWKVSQYRVFSGPNAGKYRPENTPYLGTFDAVIDNANNTINFVLISLFQIAWPIFQILFLVACRKTEWQGLMYSSNKHEI